MEYHVCQWISMTKNYHPDQLLSLLQDEPCLLGMSQMRFIMSPYITCDIQDMCTKETDIIRITHLKTSGTAAGSQLMCFMGKEMTRTTCAKVKDLTQCVSLFDCEVSCSSRNDCAMSSISQCLVAHFLCSFRIQKRCSSPKTS